MHAIPAVVQNKARAVGAEAWLDELPSLIDELCRRWRITVGAPYADATEAFVAPAEGADGTPTVLKILVPRHHAAAHDEITVLRLVDGDGCVRLLRDDAEHGALLLDRLGPSMHDLGLPFFERIDLLCDVAARVWRPAPDAGLTDGAEKAAALAEGIEERWAHLDRPCSVQARDHALRCAERRRVAHDPSRALLLHGDVHQWNTLRSNTRREGGGFTLIDPDGLLAEPEYDLGVMLREDPLDIGRAGPRHWAEHLAARTGLDPVAIEEWAVVERVSTGLVCTEVGLQPSGGQMLALADALAAEDTPPT